MIFHLAVNAGISCAGGDLRTAQLRDRRALLSTTHCNNPSVSASNALFQSMKKLRVKQILGSSHIQTGVVSRALAQPEPQLRVKLNGTPIILVNGCAQASKRV
jgi:hypothetical protein